MTGGSKIARIRFRSLVVAGLLLCGLASPSAAPARHPVRQAAAPDARLAPAFAEVDRFVAQKAFPGAVLAVGQHGRLLALRSFGRLDVSPGAPPMPADAIFDLASLTKVVATTTAAAILYDRHRLDLDAPVVRYLPAFGGTPGHDRITVRNLLTHSSGLKSSGLLWQHASDRQGILQQLYTMPVGDPPGTAFRYQDFNLILMGAIVERITGMPLDRFVRKEVFGPLGMASTGFRPPASRMARIAATEQDDNFRHMLVRGVVHDENAFVMGGVAGHAGLFSTAGDLAKLAQLYLDGGTYHGRRLLRRDTVALFGSAQGMPPGSTRALGWDMPPAGGGWAGPLASPRAIMHTGFTGTSIYIDPDRDAFVILLTNRVNPTRDNLLINQARPAIHTAVLAALDGVAPRGRVRTGIDVLEDQHFAPLQALAARHGGRLRLAILANPISVDGNGRRTIDVLRDDARTAVPGLEVVKLFSGEHGINAATDNTDIDDRIDRASGLPIVSLYGATDAQRRPSAAQLAGVDAVVIDLQDVGVRYWTFQTLTKYFLQAAAANHVELVVLDRPDPLGGVAVQGPVSTPGLEDYVTPHSEPMRPGMTLGELATMFNAEDAIGAPLTVIRMTGWQRADWYDDTGLLWINPSPNLRSLGQATAYAGTALLEGTNVNVKGPGEAPFLRFGAPWIKGVELAAYLNARAIPGVSFLPVAYVPANDRLYPFAGQRVEGVEIVIRDRDRLDAPELGVEAVAALWKLYGPAFEVERVDRLLRNRAVLDQIQAGADPRAIAAGWQADLASFQARRARYLLY